MGCVQAVLWGAAAQEARPDAGRGGNGQGLPPGIAPSPSRPEECRLCNPVLGGVLSKRINSFETQKLLLAPGAVCSIVTAQLILQDVD